MKNSDKINQILFNYEEVGPKKIINLCKDLPNKILRWLGENHPDNRTRKIFFELTNVKIGSDTVINKNLIISDDYLPLLTIGDRVAISPNVTIICSSGPNNSYLSSSDYVQKNLIVQKEVIIEDDVWIGADVTILPGVTIKKSSIIGSGSVVTKDIEGLSIVVGIPAKFAKKID